MMQPGGPGWNDPPQLSHKVYSETKTRRNILNKRVVYLDKQIPDQGNVSSLSADMPPPITFASGLTNTSTLRERTPSEQASPPVNIFIPGRVESDKNKKTKEFDEKEIVPVVEERMPNLNVNVVEELLNLSKSCENPKNKNAIDDIKKKLEILIKMYDEGSLSMEVQAKMTEMTQLLINKCYQKAWDIHVALMLDHISEVRLWMVGVKRLITELRKMNSS